jgi:hypothetical protein
MIEIHVVFFYCELHSIWKVRCASSNFCLQAVDIKLLGSLNRDDLKKICGDNFPDWISFPAFEQVGNYL